ncbi:hypothetical protein KSP40_PGU006212 [Platanthera guangdongensis]|uniref:Uncharacterized protein n=1 Tax=Platanthera guangdongensis TaxID=2320717 RepID=A0ABR2M8U3_9ASPA
MATKWSEKGPGLKILWLCTFGTAAVLITTVVRTRMQDMEKLLNEQVAISSEAADHPAPDGEFLKEE